MNGLLNKIQQIFAHALTSKISLISTIVGSSTPIVVAATINPLSLLTSTLLLAIIVSSLSRGLSRYFPVEILRDYILITIDSNLSWSLSRCLSIRLFLSSIRS